MTGMRGFGLYVHWPYCLAKCPYCDFNSHVAASVSHTEWQDAFRGEIDRVQDDLPERTLNSIFFGGGTPSLMASETVDAVISAARATWPLANDIEITLEANPTSAEAGRFRAFADAGVNRVSIGVQSLRDEDLQKLGRMHSVEDAVSAVDLAKSIFERVSFDLIYARQGQSLEQWRSELGEAIEIADGHLSLYQLTVEPGTAFGDRYSRGRLRGLPNEDLAADMYEVTQEMTEAAGLSGYEISNHARPGSESRHNLIYWRGHDWIGVGPGAHGRFTKDGRRIATESHLSPAKWLDAVSVGSGESNRQELSPKEDQEERLMMALRTSEGLLAEEFLNYSNKFNDLMEIGVLEKRGDHIRATPVGKPILNAIVRELLA